MYYILPMPIIFVAVIVKLVSRHCQFKTMEIIANIVIIIGAIFFIYFYLDYHGINLLAIIKDFLKIDK